MKRTIGLSALGILLLALVFGCSFGMTLEERITQFAIDLNLADRSAIHLNFHSTQTTDYTAINDGGFFDIDFPVINPSEPTDEYVIAIGDPSDPLVVTATIDNDWRWASGPFAARFNMAYEGFDYKIVTFEIDYGLGGGFEFVVQ